MKHYHRNVAQQIVFNSASNNTINACKIIYIQQAESTSTPGAFMETLTARELEINGKPLREKLSVNEQVTI